MCKLRVWLRPQLAPERNGEGRLLEAVKEYYCARGMKGESVDPTESTLNSCYEFYLYILRR
jgi:hypothetical protein